MNFKDYAQCLGAVFANLKLTGHNWRDHVFPSPFGQMSAWRGVSLVRLFKPIVWSRSVLHEYDELMPEALSVP
jgi:hypothetical protein